jgi:hypothetical protein
MCKDPQKQFQNLISRVLARRDNNLAMAAEYAPILVNSTADLDAKVNDTSNFNSDVAFAGMMALANEVRLSPVTGFFCIISVV